MASSPPLLRMSHWFWPRKAPLPAALWVVATHKAAAAADRFLTALAAGLPGRLALLFLDQGDYQGPYPWALLPGLDPQRILRHLEPARLLFLDDDRRARALAASATCPAWWINGSAPDLLALGHVTVASAKESEAIGGGILTGDPLVDWPVAEALASDESFCSRFRAVRAAGRWVAYFAATSAGEEALAYQTFLALAARSGGLLALAPLAAARHEEVYREAIKYNLLTIRQRRLMTSEVPPKTRVYYIEDEAARSAMYSCADVVFVGGTFNGGPVEIAPALAAGPLVIVGPKGRDPLVTAAVRAEVVSACDGGKALALEAAALLSDAPRRALQRAAMREWVCLQAGARDRVVSAVLADRS